MLPPAADTQLWQVTGARLTTYTGTRGTVTGPWQTSQLIQAVTGTAASTVLRASPNASTGQQARSGAARALGALAKDQLGELGKPAQRQPARCGRMAQPTARGGSPRTRPPVTRGIQPPSADGREGTRHHQRKHAAEPAFPQAGDTQDALPWYG